jgi:hypothetical protein
MQGVESVVDVDVSGDGSFEGLAFDFDDDEPLEGASFIPTNNDQYRLTIYPKIFESSIDSVSPWKSVPSSTGRMDVNGAESWLLNTMKIIINPVLTSSSRLVHKNLDSTTPSDFASMGDSWFALYGHGGLRSDRSKFCSKS